MVIPGAIIVRVPHIQNNEAEKQGREELKYCSVFCIKLVFDISVKFFVLLRRLHSHTRSASLHIVGRQTYNKYHHDNSDVSVPQGVHSTRAAFSFTVSKCPI